VAEEPEAGPGHGRAGDGEDRVRTAQRHHDRGRRRDRGDAARQAVQAVDEVHGVHRADQEEEGEGEGQVAERERCAEGIRDRLDAQPTGPDQGGGDDLRGELHAW
jgi:hypothetical protein